MSEKRVHVCHYEDCRKTFTRPYRLEEHLRSHSGERPHVCSSHGCGKSFLRSAHLKRHIDRSHNGAPVESVQCDRCKSWFNSKQKLSLHMINAHEKIPMYKCSHEDCEEAFHKKHQLVQHIHTRHEAGLPFRCSYEECGKSYSQKSHLDRHTTNHHKGYTCGVDGCQENFSKWSLLRKHKALDHRKELKCPECDKSFYQKNKFNQHVASHNTDRQRLVCEFPGCTRSYLDKRNLNAHIRVYHKDGKFSCTSEGCNKSFATKQKLEKHCRVFHEPCGVPPKRKKKRNRFLAAKLSGYPGKIVPHLNENEDDVIMIGESDLDTKVTSSCSVDSGLDLSSTITWNMKTEDSEDTKPGGRKSIRKVTNRSLSPSHEVIETLTDNEKEDLCSSCSMESDTSDTEFDIHNFDTAVCTGKRTLVDRDHGFVEDNDEEVSSTVFNQSMSISKEDDVHSANSSHCIDLSSNGKKEQLLDSGSDVEGNQPQSTASRSSRVNETMVMEQDNTPDVPVSGQNICQSVPNVNDKKISNDFDDAALLDILSQIKSSIPRPGKVSI